LEEEQSLLETVIKDSVQEVQDSVTEQLSQQTDQLVQQGMEALSELPLDEAIYSQLMSTFTSEAISSMSYWEIGLALVAVFISVSFMKVVKKFRKANELGNKEEEKEEEAKQEVEKA